MVAFTYPTATELRQVEQEKLPRLMAARPIFDILPLEESDSHILTWEQRDNYTGLQQFRGLDGDPPRVKALGGRRFAMQPGVYGEFRRIDEQELTVRRPWGQWEGVVSVDDLVMDAQDHLLGRRLDRIEKIGWDLLVAGVFSVAGPTGTTVHTDAYTTQTYTASDWGTAATATPLADFRAVQLLGRGTSSGFGASARAYLNQVTFNRLVANTNANDLAGRFSVLQNTVRSAQSVNEVQSGEGLPRLVIYDEGYLDETGAFQLYIPDDKVVVVGQRSSGAAVGGYRMTRNAQNPGMAPGPYTLVIDRGEMTVPRTVEVHDGHSGGPVLYLPGAIVVMSV